MAVSREDVEHIALLARLGLSAGEAEAMRHDLGRVLEYIAKLEALDTTEVEATAHVIDLPTPLRSDEVTNGDRAEAMVSNAPDRDRTFLRVPKIIE